MTDEYEKNRPFGKSENIEKRLAMWVNGLSTDKSLPWVGLGLIDDLKCACRMLGGNPDKIYPDMRKSMRSLAAATEPEPNLTSDEENELVERINATPNLQPAPSSEYDL